MNDRSDRAGGDGPRPRECKLTDMPVGDVLDHEAAYDLFEALRNATANTWHEIAARHLAYHRNRASPPSGNVRERASLLLRDVPTVTTCERCKGAAHEGKPCPTCKHVNAPPQPAPDAVREAVDAEIARWENDERIMYPDNEVLESFDRIRAALSAPPPSVQTETPAQSSPCRRYVNGDGELVCKCVNGKYPEVVDMERRPPTCKAVASHCRL